MIGGLRMFFSVMNKKWWRVRSMLFHSFVTTNRGICLRENSVTSFILVLFLCVFFYWCWILVYRQIWFWVWLICEIVRHNDERFRSDSLCDELITSYSYWMPDDYFYYYYYYLFVDGRVLGGREKKRQRWWESNLTLVALRSSDDVSFKHFWAAFSLPLSLCVIVVLPAVLFGRGWQIWIAFGLGPLSFMRAFSFVSPWSNYPGPASLSLLFSIGRFGS